MSRINEEVVLNYYLNLMEDDQVEFMKGKPHVKKEVRNCINQLKQEEQIHNRIGVAKELWKILFEAAMSFIHPDKSGYDELFDYFDKFVEFEELIFATDSFYRDHTLHCLWVYFLGEYIYNKDEFYKIVRKDRDETNHFLHLLGYLMKDEEIIKKVGKEGKETFEALEKYMSMEQAVHCITALTHDLGYPIKKINRINSSIGKILPNFSIKSFSEFDFKYNNEQVQFIKTFIDFIGDDIHTSLNFTDEDGGRIRYDVNPDMDDTEAIFLAKKELLKGDSLKHLVIKHSLKQIPAQRLRYSCDFESYQHGIMSAYLLMTTLRTFKTMNFIHDKDDQIIIDMNHYANLASKQDILKAISDHTSDGFRIQDLSHVSQFLTFIDELEEFSRISRGNQYRQYINEFCQTDLYIKDDIFHIDFIFDNEEIVGLDPERAFKGKCKRLLSLFDIPQLSEDLKIHYRVLGRLKKDQKIYELIIKNKFAKIIIDGEEQAIPQYLNSRDFLTSEEYALLREDEQIMH
ncbi:hypothetical protein [Vallitalea okinawensis]|uniref:hypothetical protein n=1 Tax=Vallitalea okinawensis TaxID=2078660 RepID=UPI000CFC4F44|nr:hypothetical protein [Vallitalea okinawensis]